jgi:predicted flavoprotein YhiN
VGLAAGLVAAGRARWADGLGAATFVGSSGKVFPHEMKAAPLLRAWLQRLRRAGVRFHMRHRWLPESWLPADGPGPALRHASGEQVGAGRRAAAGPGRGQLGAPGVGWALGAALQAAGIPWRRCNRPTAASTWVGANTWPATMPGRR